MLLGKQPTRLLMIFIYYLQVRINIVGLLLILPADKYIWHKLDVKARPSAFHSLATFTEGEHVKIVIIGGYNHLKDEVYSSMMEVFATKCK